MAFKENVGGVKPADTRTSSPQNTSVGSGSRPTGGKIAIPTSAPTNPKTLGRDVPGSLK